MRKPFISEEEADKMSDYALRDYTYCRKCKRYHLCNILCDCTIKK